MQDRWALASIRRQVIGEGNTNPTWREAIIRLIKNESPRLSVQTVGQEKWLIEVQGRSQAEKAHRQIRSGGLKCGPIRESDVCYNFTVDGR